MATTYSRALLCYNGTDADFRRWCQFIHDGLAAAGWVQTNDTGQINLTTVTKPTTNNQSKGYEIWRMADSLQATKPIYIRIDYGSGSGATNDPGIMLKVGSGSNGSGSLTGTVYSDGGSALSTFYSGSSSSTQATDSWTSGDTNRFCCAVAVSDAGTYGLVFGIERGKNSTGGDDGTYVLVAGNKGLSRLTQMASAIHGNGSSEHLGTPSYMLPGYNPSARSPRVAVGLIFPFDWGFKAMRPGRNFVMSRSSDSAKGAKFQMRWDKQTGTYQRISGFGANCNIVGGADTSSRLFMRYD